MHLQTDSLAPPSPPQTQLLVTGCGPQCPQQQELCDVHDSPASCSHQPPPRVSTLSMQSEWKQLMVLYRLTHRCSVLSRTHMQLVTHDPTAATASQFPVPPSTHPHHCVVLCGHLCCSIPCPVACHPWFLPVTPSLAGLPPGAAHSAWCLGPYRAQQVPVSSRGRWGGQVGHWLGVTLLAQGSTV